MTARNDTHLRIKSVLVDRELTAIEIAKDAGVSKLAVQVAINGMLKRREVRAIRRKVNGMNQAARYRLGDAS